MFQMVIKANGERPYPARYLPEDAANDCLQWVEKQTPEMVSRLKAILDQGEHWKGDADHYLHWNLRTIYAEQCHPDVMKAEAIRHLWTLVEIDHAAN